MEEEKGEPMRDHHAVQWGRRTFLGSVSLVGAAGFFGLTPRPSAAESPPDKGNPPMPSKERVELNDGAIRLPAQVSRPHTPGVHPAIIVAPGGLEQGVIPAYDWIASRLVDAGYVTLTITYRAKQGVHDPQDVLLGLDWLEGQPDVDRQRFALFGHSRGGLTALRTAAQDPRVRSVVSFAAPTDIPHYVRSVASYAPARYRDVVQWMGGTPEELPERYTMLRGLSYADRIRQPVLLIQGTLDMITPLEHTLWMERALREAGNQQVRVEMIDRMGHFCELTGQGYQFDRVAGLVIQWFNQTLPEGSQTRDKHQ
jgi:dipeptidyl aminopeptidase/acylaminoacyl peptidase